MRKIDYPPFEFAHFLQLRSCTRVRKGKQLKPAAQTSINQDAVIPVSYRFSEE